MKRSAVVLIALMLFAVFGAAWGQRANLVAFVQATQDDEIYSTYVYRSANREFAQFSYHNLATGAATITSSVNGIVVGIEPGHLVMTGKCVYNRKPAWFYFEVLQLASNVNQFAFRLWDSGGHTLVDNGGLFDPGSGVYIAP